MATTDMARTGSTKPDHYLDLVDLYAARAIRARTVLATDVHQVNITPVGRNARRSSMHIPQVSNLYRSRRWRIASAAMAVLITLSIVARTTLAAQTYRVQDGDTIHIVADRFDVDAVTIVQANNLLGGHANPTSHPRRRSSMSGPGSDPRWRGSGRSALPARRRPWYWGVHALRDCSRRVSRSAFGVRRARPDGRRDRAGEAARTGPVPRGGRTRRSRPRSCGSPGPAAKPW